MGIGRFAFTPLMPLMMRDGLIDAEGGAELAAANYLGYLMGALSAAPLARRPLRLVLASLLAIVVITAGAGLVEGQGWWLVLRWAAGMASAWTMVGISTWALGELARRGHGRLAPLLFAGVGIGIVLIGGLAWAAHSAGARSLWLQLAAVAAVLSAGVAWLVRHDAGPTAVPGSGSAPANTAVPKGDASAATSTRRAVLLVVCYGVTGFGYILPATFLPAMARALIDDPQRFGLAWPVFGGAALASMLLMLRGFGSTPPLRVWALCQLAIGLGTALPLLSRSGWALGCAALLVGGTFMVATMIGLQQARALAPLNPARLLGRMTAAFALGQIAGPLVVRLLTGVQWRGWGPVEISSAAATLLMLATAVWLWRSGGPVLD
jgi:MFS family permease